MLTLQERMDALYSQIINSRVEDLNRARNAGRSELCALRIMNLFLRREDEALHAILPGLMDPNELARRYRRTTLVAHGDDSDFVSLIANAKRQFRTLKAVLSNTIAAQFFKTFCVQRGRSSVNSFFFLMDVSWLHQVESGARNEQSDFLSAMFSDSVAPSPAMSPRGYVPGKSEDGSSEILYSPEASAIDLQLAQPQPEPDRPHHSHFAKKNTSRPSSASGSRDPTPSTSPTPAEDDKKPKVPKLPIAKVSGAQTTASLSPRPSNAAQFLTKIGEGIAHLVHESYFGRKSLAQRDMRHAALLGCSQVPDYLILRDKDRIVYSPTMYDNLVSAVTKKFTADVLPQFLNSVCFQVMVYSLEITGFFEDRRQDEKKSLLADEQMPLFKEDMLLKGLWQACISAEKNEKKDDESSSSDDSDSDESEEEEDEEPKKKDEKKEEPKKEKESESSDGDNDIDGDDDE